MSTIELQLKTLRLAYKVAKTDAERQNIKNHAELLLHPATPEESAEIETAVNSTIMALPDWNHPHWKSK